MRSADLSLRSQRAQGLGKRRLAGPLTWAAITWEQVDRVTSDPLCYSIVLLAIATLVGRQIWVTSRPSVPLALSLTTLVLTAAGFAIVLGRLVALALA
jgi:hypothetical protein